jgi:hypothetical protein
VRPLAKNKIEDDGVKFIWESLKKNNALRNLSLGIAVGGL